MKIGFQFRSCINMELIVIEECLYSFYRKHSNLKLTKIDSFILLGSSDLTSARNYQQPPVENPTVSESVSKRILNYTHVKVLPIVK